MRKIDSLDRTLIDFLSFVLIYTCFYGVSSMLVQGFVGAVAGFHRYLIIVGSVLLYTYLYYDSRMITKILPFVKGGNTLDRALMLILFLPVLLPILAPAEFPTVEHKYWIGSDILIAFFLSVRHVGIYTHDIMAGFARYIFIGMAGFVVLFYILMPHNHLLSVLPTNAVYLVIILTTTVLLLHLLRLDERSEHFVKREFLLLVFVFVIVFFLYFSGLIALIEQVLNAMYEGLLHVLSAFVRLFRPGEDMMSENIRETLPTVEVSTAEPGYTAPIMTGEVLMTTMEELPEEIRRLDPRTIYIPAILLALCLAYWIAGRNFKKQGSQLFIEERESIARETEEKSRRRRAIFAKKTTTERIRNSYKRFMRRLEHSSDTTSNLERYIRDISRDKKQDEHAEQLTEIYRRTRYLDRYEPSEEEAHLAEQDVKSLEGR